MQRPDHNSRRPTTALSRFSPASETTVISLQAPSGRELEGCPERRRHNFFGSIVAIPVIVVTDDPSKETSTMARSPSIIRQRTRKPRRTQVEERPVLQLPLERPTTEWREPTKREPEPSERGVAVIDFYI